MINADRVVSPAGGELIPLRRNRRFQALWIGGMGSSLGLQLSAIANPLLVLALTGSPVLAGVVAFVEMAAMVLAGIPAGIVLDRFNRRRVLITAETVRAISAGSVCMTAYFGVADVAQLVAVSAIMGGAMSFASAAQTLAVRSVVPAEQLTGALTRQQVRAQAATLAGPSAAGALYALSHCLPYLGMSIGYTLSATAGLAVPRSTQPRSGAPARPGGRPLSGITMLLRNPLLRATILTVSLINLVGSGLTLLVVLLVTQHGGTAHTVGFVSAGAAVGGLLGTGLVSHLHRLLRPGQLLIVLTLWLAALTASLSLPFGAWWYAVALGLSLLGIPALIIMLDVLIFRQVPDEFRGRTITSTQAVLRAGMPLGPIAVGVLVQYAGLNAACLVLSAVLMASAAYAGTQRALRAAVWPATEPGT